MNEIKLPLLRRDDKPFFPKDGNCPICSTLLKHGTGVAYLCAGAIWVNDDGDSVNELSGMITAPEAFCNIGFHGKDTEVRESVNVSIVDSLLSDQFDINFCSLACLRSWLNRVVDDLEEQLRKAQSRNE